MRQGFTLIELVAALAIVALLFGIALPRFIQLRDGIEVYRAAQEVAAAHRRAQMTAIVQRSVVVLTITPDSMVMRSRTSGTTLWRGPGPLATGVALSDPIHHVVFSPVGLAIGVSNATYALSRGDAHRSVIVSRLGRIRFAP